MGRMKNVYNILVGSLKEDCT